MTDQLAHQADTFLTLIAVLFLLFLLGCRMIWLGLRDERHTPPDPPRHVRRVQVRPFDWKIDL